MNVPLFIARRYLFARKSHNVINVISAISAAGMAIGTAALVLILSVYNGFDSLIEKNVGDLSPDLLMVSPEHAAHFEPDSLLLDRLAADERVAGLRCVLEDNVFLTYGERQSIARARGVDDGFEDSGALVEHIYEGTFQLHKGDIPTAIVGSSLARKLNIHPRFIDPVILYYPDREGQISPSNPTASARSAKVFPAGLMSISSEVDAELIIVPLHTMRSLMGSRGEEVSGVELILKDGTKKGIRSFKRSYAAECRLLDRYEQQPTLFKMMRYEKLAVFFILLFVVLIVALNIYGSLSMLIIEKTDDVATLRAMGASDGLVRRIFVFEGWLISLLGMITGLVAGVSLALAQQKFGLVKMPGNFLIESYPVILKAQDIVLTVLSVAVVGLVIALLSTGRKKLNPASP
ncbi:MAG: ABC transporter permease [Bacteroidales bacterium]|nr:ABC transporter permease [Bacteroidales bacterium]